VGFCGGGEGFGVAWQLHVHGGFLEVGLGRGGGLCCSVVISGVRAGCDDGGDGVLSTGAGDIVFVDTGSQSGSITGSVSVL